MTIHQINEDQTVTEVVVDKVEGQRVALSIDGAALKILEEERIDINQLFIMLAMYEDYIGLLDLYDKNSTSKKVLIMEYQDLHIHGFLEESGTDKLYQITEKGRAFVERIRPLLEVGEEEKEDKLKLRFLCEQYLLIFPKIKLPSGKPARVSILEIEKKMKAWIKSYKPVFKKEGIKLTDGLILETTKNYVTRYAKDGYLYMATSSYFIQKNEKSALADEILANTQGLDKVKTNITIM